MWPVPYMSLVLLSITPNATAAFVIVSKYEQGIELITASTVIGTVLLLPANLIYLYVPKVIGIWDYDLSNLGGSNVTTA